MMTSSFFLVIEGLDGSGKTVVTRKLVDLLRATLEERVILTFEPHDPSCSGLFLRQALKKRRGKSLDWVNPMTLALAFAANRFHHVQREIEPFLRTEHSVVVCDRYYLSSLVYQSKDILMEKVYSLNEGVRKPDLTIFLNASTQNCRRRMAKRNEDKELYDTELDDTTDRYFAAIEFLRARGERIIEVDANGTVDEVLDRILQILSGNDGPEWLRIQRWLGVEFSEPEFITINGENTGSASVDEVVAKLASAWNPIVPLDPKLLINEFLVLEKTIEDEMDELHLDDVCSLFREFLEIFGYKFGERVPWTDVVAFRLECSLPLSFA